MSIQYGLIAADQFQAFLPLLPEGQQDVSTAGVYAIGAVKEGQASGILLFRADDLTATIQYVSVAEDRRHQGIANGMIDFLCRYAWENNVAVLGSFAAADWDDPLCSLLTKRGDFTVRETEDYVCCIPCAGLEHVELNVAPPVGSHIAAFYSLPDNTQRVFLAHMKENDSEFAAGVQEGRGRMLDPLCLCMVDGSGAVTAALFCRNDGGDVSLLLAYALPGHARAMMALASRLRELLVQTVDTVPYLRIAAVTPESRKLVDTLLPGREITAHFFTICWDMNTMGG